MYILDSFEMNKWLNTLNVNPNDMNIARSNLNHRKKLFPKGKAFKWKLTM